MEVFDSDGKSIFDAEPKRKKKYVLFLFSLNHESENRIRTIEKAIQQALSQHVLIRFEEADEGIKALLVKNIDLIFIDYSLFEDDRVSVDFALECKKRKLCPIFFSAKDEHILISEYREKMKLYQELDDYFIDPIDFVEITKKLTRATEIKGRQAKRFSLDIPIRMYRLNTDKTLEILLSDLSLVGFGLKITDNTNYIKNEQIKIMIPLYLFKIFHTQYGEFLPLSGKVQRITIDGQFIGCSIEHATPMQIDSLMNLLEKVTRKMRLVKLAQEVKPLPELP